MRLHLISCMSSFLRMLTDILNNKTRCKSPFEWQIRPIFKTEHNRTKLIKPSTLLSTISMICIQLEFVQHLIRSPPKQNLSQGSHGITKKDALQRQWIEPCLKMGTKTEFESWQLACFDPVLPFQYLDHEFEELSVEWFPPWHKYPRSCSRFCTT